jgi:CRISPR/Cas system-associated exonuclease Cas4 (RecB family)
MSTDLLLTREERTSQRGSVWTYVSPSRLNTWLACPLKFKLVYLEGLRSPTTPSLFLGKCCHSVLETVYRHRQLGVGLEITDISRRLRESWAEMIDQEGMKFESSAQEQAMQKQVVDLVDAYLKAIPSDEPRPLAVEAALEMPLVDPETDEDLGIPLVGIVDLILDGQAGAVIADFKTAARSAEPLEILHEVQLSCYAWLFRQTEGRAEGGLEIRSLIKTKVPKVEIHAYARRTERHFRRLFALFHAYLDALDKGVFTFRPGFHCGMCDHCQTHCRQWSG